MFILGDTEQAECLAGLQGRLTKGGLISHIRSKFHEESRRIRGGAVMLYDGGHASGRDSQDTCQEEGMGALEALMKFSAEAVLGDEVELQMFATKLADSLNDLIHRRHILPIACMTRSHIVPKSTTTHHPSPIHIVAPLSMSKPRLACPYTRVTILAVMVRCASS